ncbi:MAG: YIP1 family protein [Chloroflexales bacterium]|nr:YIP1 family protein [Chloroflexales bacterium]
MSMSQQTSIPQMVTQSRDVLTNPSVPTFERYERRGTFASAAIYVGLAALIAGVLGSVGGLGGIIYNAISALINFFLFTGLVYYIGKQQGGTGTFDEVAYTFSLFIAPLAVIGAAIGLVLGILGSIPFLGIVAGLAGALVAIIILVAQVYFAYLAVQSSMNIVDQGKALITLGGAFLATVLIQIILGMLF